MTEASSRRKPISRAKSKSKIPKLVIKDGFLSINVKSTNTRISDAYQKWKDGIAGNNTSQI